MQCEQKPNKLLNAFYFLLPFPATFFLPIAISFFVTIILQLYIYDPYDHILVKAIPLAYLIFLILEFALAIILVKNAASPRKKAAAQNFLYGTKIIVILVIILLVSFVLPSLIEMIPLLR